MTSYINQLREIRKRIVKYELAIDGMRTIISKGSLSPKDNETLLFALNQCDIGTKELDLLGLTGDSSNKLVQSCKVHIPFLKGLVEKELVETFSLVAEVERKTDSLKDPGFMSKLSEIQDVESSLKLSVRNLYKHLKLLQKMDVVEAIFPIQNSLRATSTKSVNLLQETQNQLDALMVEIFAEASQETLDDVYSDLQSSLNRLEAENGTKKQVLATYEEHKDELLSLAAQLNDINSAITLKSAALKSLSQDLSFNLTL